MMSITHAAIATAATAVSLGTADAFVLGTAILGSQLPDLDTTESFMGRALYPIARWLEERYPHRTITHSFLSSVVVAIATAPLLYFLHWHYWAAIVLGQFCGWFSDAFTRSGVAAFYPSPARLVIPGNPRARLRSQSPAEYWVLGTALFLAVVSVNLSSAGGITEQFARSFFPDTATTASLFQKYGAEQQILVRVEGLHVHTSQAVTGEYLVIEATSNDVLAQSTATGKLYKIGTAADVQIRPNRIHSRLGDRLSITAEEMAMQELLVREWVTRLPPDSYVSGSLLLEEMEAVQIPLELERYPTLRVFGGQVELSNARPPEIEALLGEFWILSGKAIVKVRAL